MITERLLRLVRSYAGSMREAGAAGAVHAHHVGAEVGEEHGGERARPDARQLDHAHPGERAGSCRCHQAPSTVTQLM